jgi:hypothetical protein
VAALFALDDPQLRRDVARAARAEGILGDELRELAASDPDPHVRQAACEDDATGLEVGLAPAPSYA